MPRSMPDRTIGGDRTVAQRVAEERKARDWTLELVSRRMEAAGCPIHISALHKLEKGHPPRRVTVDELVAFSNVFEMSVQDLVTPAALLKDRKLRRLASRWWEAREALAAAREELLRAETWLRAHLRKNPETWGDLEVALSAKAHMSIESEDEAKGLVAELSMLLARSRMSLTEGEQQALDARGTGVDR